MADYIYTYTAAELQAHHDTIAAGGFGGGPSLGEDSVIRTNAKVISENITFLGTENGTTAGPIEIADGFTVDVTTGSTWSIV